MKMTKLNRYYLLYSLLFALLLPASVLSQKTAQSEEEVKKNAADLFYDGGYSTALPLYSQLLSLYPKDPNFSYRFGACKLFAEKDKEAPLTYLEYGANDPAVEPEAFFFLAKAYHLNYRFDEAMKYYKMFQEKGEDKSKEKLLLDRHMVMCDNGKKLLKNVSDIIVLEKKTLSKGDFFRNYDLSEFGGKIIKTPDEFKLSFDVKKKMESVMYLQPNADVVYFSSYGENGLKGKDIYFSIKTPDGNWGIPQLLPGPVNTEFDEDYAFIHPNGTLYFSSTGHNSMGGYDVFKSVFDEASQQWSYPQNIDFAINTPGDDYLYITDMDEKNAYFSSTRESSENEVTVYRVKVDRIPVDIVIIKGAFIAESTKSAKITIEDLKDGKISGVFNTNPSSGDYVLTVPNGGKFKFIVETAESPAYSGMVDIPRQKTLKTLRQEMHLVADNGEQGLIIKNIFDEEVSGDVTVLLAEIYKEKASLDVNADEIRQDTLEAAKPQPEVTATVKDSLAADSVQTAPPHSTAAKSENISNEQIIKIAKEDAAGLQKEASDIRLEKEIAYSIANEKNRLSAEKSKEAEEYLSVALYAADPAEKQQKLEIAKKSKKESKLYAEQAVAAYNLAREIEKSANDKQKEADIAFNYAQELENAVQQNSPEAAAEKLAQLNDFLEKQKNQPAESDRVADFEKQVEEKRKEADIQSKLAKKLEEDVTNLESDIKTLKTAAQTEKKKKEKERLEEQASILERDLPAMQAEAQTAKELAEKSGKELLDLEKQESILSSVVSEIKSTDRNSVSLNTTDKTKLETDISSSEERIAKLEQELSSDTSSNAVPMVSIVSTEEKKDTLTSPPEIKNDTAAAASVDGNPDYNLEFQKKLEALENQPDSSGKNEARANQLNQWADALDNEASATRQKALQAAEGTEKISLNEKALTLENQAKEKRLLAGTTIAVADAGTNTTANTQNLVTNATEEPLPEDYNNYFKQKIESSETLADPVKKEEDNARDYDRWAKAIEEDAKQLGLKADTTSDVSEKNTLVEKATALEISASEKRQLSKESEVTAVQIRLSSPATSENSVPTSGNNDIAVYSQKYIEAEKAAMSIQNEKDKALTLAEINKEWANDISKEIVTLQQSVDAIPDESKKAERKEMIRLLEELKKEKESKAQQFAENAIDAASPGQAASAPVVINENEIPSDYAPWFETKLIEQEKINNPSEKEEAKTAYYEQWTKSIDNEIQQIKAQSDTSRNEEEKRILEEKLVKLEVQSAEKKEMAVQSRLQADKLKSEKPAEASAAGTDKVGVVSTSGSEKAVSLQDQAFTAQLDEFVKQNNSEGPGNNPTEIQLKEEEYKAELYEKWRDAINKDVQQLKVLRDATESEPEKQKLELLIAESEMAAQQKRQWAKQSSENANRLKEENANTTPEITEEQVKAEVEKTNSTGSAQQADSLQTEVVLMRDKANQMGFFKKKKKAALLNEATKAETASEIAREKSELAAERATLIENSIAERETDNLLPQFAYKKMDDRAASLESEATYLDDLAKATKDSLAIVKKKKQKEGIFLRASQLEQKAAAKREEAEKFKTISAEVKSKEEEAFKQRLFKNIVEAEKNDSILPFAKIEMDSAEIETLKENETLKIFSDRHKEVKNLYLQQEIESIESGKMGSEAGKQLLQFSTASASLDTIKDKKIKEQYIKDALEFAVQARTKQVTSDSLGQSARKKEKSGDEKLLIALEELYRSNDMDLFGKALAYQYLKPPDTIPVIVAADTLPKDTLPKEVTPPVVEETFILGNTSVAYNDKNPIPVNPKYPDGLIWQVQIGAFRNPIPQDLFKGFAPIMGVKVRDGITRYSAGMFMTFATANSARAEIVKLGYKDAFVVAYRDGQRISITEARALIAKGLFPTDISATPELTVAASNASAQNENGNVSPAGGLPGAGLIYTVQIGVYSKPASEAQLKNVKPVSIEKLGNGTIRYTSGVYRDFSAASAAKDNIVGAGIKDAFVTAYLDGKRISLAQARNLGNPPSNDNSKTVSGEGLAGNGIIFRVQLGKYNGEVPVDIAGIILEMSRNNGKQYKDDKGNEVYLCGTFKDVATAESCLKDALAKGLQDAVVVAFNNGIPIDLEEAKKMINQ